MRPIAWSTVVAALVLAHAGVQARSANAAPAPVDATVRIDPAQVIGGDVPDTSSG